MTAHATKRRDLPDLDLSGAARRRHDGGQLGLERRAPARALEPVGHAGRYLAARALDIGMPAIKKGDPIALAGVLGLADGLPVAMARRPAAAMTGRGASCASPSLPSILFAGYAARPASSSLRLWSITSRRTVASRPCAWLRAICNRYASPATTVRPRLTTGPFKPRGSKTSTGSTGRPGLQAHARGGEIRKFNLGQ
jgi:hypothetical protein